MGKKILKDVIYYLSDEQGFVASVIEKDFYLTRILNGINEYLSTDIVFKGGTLLNKVYLNYHRLSEDLDFAYRGDVDLSTRGKRSKAIMPIREKIPAFLDMLELTSDNPEGNGFDFNRSDFLKMVDEKLRLDGYERDYSHNLGLSEQAIKELKRSINVNLVLMIRRDEKFDLDEVLVFFNKLFKKKFK